MELQYPWVRQELVSYLEELAALDPRPIWAAELTKGQVIGIDQIIHFFFDDHDFDDSDVGYSLIDDKEVLLIQTLKSSLDRLVDLLPRGNDDDYVRHPDWAEVTCSAKAALDYFEARPSLA